MTIKHRASRPEKLMRLASRLLSVLLLSAAPLALADDAGSDPTRVEFNIPVQTVPAALSEFARQARVQLFFISDGYEDVRANALFGTYTRQEALDLLLDGTGLKASISPDSGIELKPVSSTMSLRSGESRLFAAVGEVAVADGAGGSRDSGGLQAERGRESDDVWREKRPIEEIVVTGTNIRGIAPESSPVRTFTREDIQISGAGTVQNFIQTLTGNFGGGANADLPAGLPDDANSGFNGVQGTLGSSVNLRGLGSGSTLVLLNGHRLAPSSGIGDFTDISMIPTTALERIEVLTDGASSIYGGDAVAGVVNFILRDDFDGIETSIRYGTVTEGDHNEYRASITGGKNWSTGHALLVYEFLNQTDLRATDRSFSQHAPVGNDLLPRQRRHSVLGSFSQSTTPNLELFADFLFSTRDAAQDFTDPSGQRFHSSPSSENLGLSGGGSWKLSDSWVLDFSGAYNNLNSDTNVLGPSPNIRELDSQVWTVDAKSSGTLMRFPGGDMKLAIGGHYREEEFSNFNVISDITERKANRKVYSAFGEAFIPIVGSSNAVPGIKQLNINVSGRFDDYSDFGSTVNPKVGAIWSPVDSIRLRGSYSTSFNPPPLGRVGATDFRANAFRTSFINSVLGLTPGDPSIADVVVLLASGTAKDLDAENSRAFTGGLDFNGVWGRHNLALTTTYFDIDFDGRLASTPVPENRLAADAHNIAFNSPGLFPKGAVIFFPAQNELDNFLSSLDILNAIGGAVPSDAEIINLVPVVRNLARTSVNGFDFDIAYTLGSDLGEFSLGLDSTFLIDFQQQAAATTPSIEQLNTLFNPVDLKLRGRAGYANNGFVADIFVNHTDNYRVDATASAARIASWTTVDFSVSYDTRMKFASSILDNTVLRLSIQNLFDATPPTAPSDPQFLIFGYDPANASPRGRFIAFELTKRFQQSAH